MNPTVPQRIIDEAMERNPASRQQNTRQGDLNLTKPLIPDPGQASPSVVAGSFDFAEAAGIAEWRPSARQ
jgi:hypothetical protein